MSQNSNFPLTNAYLINSIMKKNQPIYQTEATQTSSPQSQSCSKASLKVNEHPEHNQISAQQFGYTFSCLSYSVDAPNFQEESSNNPFSRLVSDQSFHICNHVNQNMGQTDLLNELLACDEEQQGDQSHLAMKVKKEEAKEGEQLVQTHQKVSVQNQNILESYTDYSDELNTLKSKLVLIESIAQQEIVRLKKQLASKQGSPEKVEKVSIGVNTEEDLRDQELEILKQALRRHITLNKELLRKQIKDEDGKGNYTKENMQSNFGKICV